MQPGTPKWREGGARLRPAFREAAVSRSRAAASRDASLPGYVLKPCAGGAGMDSPGARDSQTSAGPDNVLEMGA